MVEPVTETTTDAAEGTQAHATAGHHTQLSRDLRCFDITMIGVAAMIGAGIFVLTGIAAGVAGPALVLAFALNGIVALLTAVIYAELGSAIPEAGGGYLWIKEGLPGGNAFLSGWMSWFAHAVAGSVYALGFGAYVGYILAQFHVSLGGISPFLLGKVLAVLAILAFIYINYRGASDTGMIGNIVTSAKVLILFVFIISGLIAMFGHPTASFDKFTPLVPDELGLAGIFSAMGLTFIAFEGYEIIVQAGEEVKDPKRNIPRAVFWSMAIVVPICMFVALVSLGAVDTGSAEPTWHWLAANKELGLVYAAGQFMPLGTILLLAGGVLASMSALNATTFSSTRVSFAMGRDRNLPDAFARIHGKTRTPWVSLLASGAIMIGMAIAIPIEDVAAAADIMFLLLFIQVHVACITIRKKYGDKLDYGYMAPFHPVIPALGITANLALALFMFYYSPLAWFVALGWLAVGWCLWLFYAKPRERGKHVTPVLMGEMMPREKKRFRVLVPVANPDTARGLLTFAARMARVKEGEVIVLHAVTVPTQLPPSAGRRLIQEARPMIDEISAFVDGLDVPNSSLVRISHGRIWRAIVDTIEEYDIDFVTMGWRGASHDPHTVVGDNIDRVIRHANCDIAVLQNVRQIDFERVLVPVAQPHQGELMLNVARVLANPQAGRIDLLHIRPPEGPAGEQPAEQGRGPLEAIREMAREAVGQQPDVSEPSIVSVVVAESGDPIGEIIRRAEDYDLLVIGSTRQRWLSRVIFPANPKRIEAQVECPVVLVSRRSSVIKYNVQTFFDFFRTLRQQAEEEAAESKA